MWMVTFSDMVTLLLTFFVLLLSMAKMDATKFRDAAGSLRGAFGVMGSADKTEVSTPQVINSVPIYDDFTSRVYKRLLSQINRLRIDKEIKLVKDRGSVLLRINSAILFDSGSTKLKPEAYPVLRKVAALVQPLPMSLRIEGHSDSQPSSTDSMSNWDISVQRAVSVLKAMVSEQLLPTVRVSAVGYGATKPLVENDTPENRALNRRVEFYLEDMGNTKDQLPYLIDAGEQLPF